MNVLMPLKREADERLISSGILTYLWHPKLQQAREVRRYFSRRIKEELEHVVVEFSELTKEDIDFVTKEMKKADETDSY